MKALIWFLTILAATILNVLLGYATGIEAGYVVFYIAVYFVAKRLCKAWETHKTNRENAGVTPIDADPAEPTGFQYVDDSVPNRNDVVFEIATSNKKDLSESICITQNPQILFCRKCGFKLIDGSDFCSRCGTSIVKE
jgi:hypothetical protein